MGDSSKQGLDILVQDLIKIRKSVRTYNEEPLDENIKQRLQEYMSNISGVFNSSLRFCLVDSNQALTSGIQLGTYGFIKGASTYIIAVVDNSENNIEDVGYALEKVILYATSLGLGTCWLGGTLRRKAFLEAVHIKPGEVMPAITPVGFAKKSERMLVNLLKFVAGSKKRKEWAEIFFESNLNTPLNPENIGRYKEVLEMVRLAPSASNKQPWRIIHYNDAYHFYLSHTTGMVIADIDMQRLDMGIAMCHFELTAKELNLAGAWYTYNPELNINDSNLEYIVTWKEC